MASVCVFVCVGIIYTEFNCTFFCCIKYLYESDIDLFAPCSYILKKADVSWMILVHKYYMYFEEIDYQ